MTEIFLEINVMSIRTSNRKVLGSTPDRTTRISFFRSMPVSLSRIIHHSEIFLVVRFPVYLQLSMQLRKKKLAKNSQLRATQQVKLYCFPCSFASYRSCYFFMQLLSVITNSVKEFSPAVYSVIIINISY